MTKQKSLETYLMIVSMSPYEKSRETYFMILVSISDQTKKSGNLFNDRINEPIRKKSGNLFHDTGINVTKQKSLETYLMIVSMNPYE